VGDPQRLGQVLSNLLSNGVKFTEKGRVSLHVDMEEDTISPLLHFHVDDTGIGISAEKLSVIFEPFSQADGSYTRRYGGAGVGLAICARFVEMMEGRIWVESELGKGSRFHFTARFRPPIQPGQSEIASPARDLPPSITRLKILLAEDNPVNLKLAVRLLQKRGHGVVTAANGAEAVAAFERQPFDAVLMDVQMPQMDGLEATTEIRSLERPTGKRIKIVAITAHGGQGDRERCLKAGMDDYLRKPIRPAELFDAIERPPGPR